MTINIISSISTQMLNAIYTYVDLLIGSHVPYILWHEIKTNETSIQFSLVQWIEEIIHMTGHISPKGISSLLNSEINY